MGINYDKLYELTDKQLERAINRTNWFEPDLCRELCDRASMAAEYDAVEAVDGDLVAVAYAAAKKLGLDIVII
nr:MAG TPA: protein of unknown function (DUF1967) [Caudoviricetes sp.]